MPAPLEFGIFAALVLLVLAPFVPGLYEIVRPRDGASLAVDREYATDPRYFGREFRRRLSSRESPWRIWTAPVVIGPEDVRSRVLLATRSLRARSGTELGEAFSAGAIDMEPDTRARVLVSDDTIRLYARCSVAEWVDAHGPIDVGEGTDLGRSASSGGRLSLAPGVRFRRLWGCPIVVGRRAEVVQSPLRARDGNSPANEIVSARDHVIGEHAEFRGTVHADSIRVGAGAHVVGNLIAADSVEIAQSAVVFGHVFAGQSVRLGPKSVVGCPDDPQTVYCRTIALAPGAVVWGWIVADRGGMVMR